MIYGPKGFWALEVKRSSNLGPDDVKGLIAFQEEYPEAQCFILTQSKRRETYRGFPCLPVEEFLLNLSPDHLGTDAQ